MLRKWICSPFPDRNDVKEIETLCIHVSILELENILCQGKRLCYFSCDENNIYHPRRGRGWYCSRASKKISYN